MSKERNDKVSIICFTAKPSHNFFVYRIQSKENFLIKKELFKEKGLWRIEENPQKGFLIAIATAIMKDPITSIKKHATELKVHKKTERTGITQN